MIIDRSSSMSSVRDQTISGLNEQVQSMKLSQKEHDDQEQIASLVLFDSSVDHEIMWNKKVGDIEDFDRDSYSPRGCTALYDAVGASIHKLREEIKDDLKERKVSVVVTILTDGEENSSRHFNGKQISSLVSEIQETGQWTVSFVGCGDNVFDVAKSMGINRGNTMCYVATQEGTTSAFNKMAEARSVYSTNISRCLSENVGMDSVQKGFYDDGVDDIENLGDVEDNNK